MLPSPFQSHILKKRKIPKFFFPFLSFFLLLNPTPSQPPSSIRTPPPPPIFPSVDLFTCMHPQKAEAESFQYTRLASTCKPDLSSRRTKAAEGGVAVDTIAAYISQLFAGSGIAGSPPPRSSSFPPPPPQLRASLSPALNVVVLEEQASNLMAFCEDSVAPCGHKRRRYSATQLALAR